MAAFWELWGGLFNGNSQVGILAEAIFAESSKDATNADEKSSIAAAILNRLMIVNGYDTITYYRRVWGAAGAVAPGGPGQDGFGWAGSGLAGIVGYPGQFATFQTTTAGQTSAQLVAGAQQSLKTPLNSGDKSGDCKNLAVDYGIAYQAYKEMQLGGYSLFADGDFAPTSFNSFKTPHKSLLFEGSDGVSYGTPNVFYGISMGVVRYNATPVITYAPIRRPMPIRRSPPQKGRVAE